jgi:CRISPR/Cas system-associated exonuclease Cas4 (RecB family)
VDKLEKPWRAAALAFGTSVHAAVEYFQKELLAGRGPLPDAVLAQFDADWYAQNVEPLVFSDKDTQESLREKGHELLMLYIQQANGSAPAAIEEGFELDLVDPETGEDLELRLRGYIDLVETDGTVVDLKTAARSMAMGDLERHLQLSVYALAQFLRRGEIPKLRLDMLLKTKVARLERQTTSRSLEDLSWTAQLLKRAARAIEAQHFYPNPSWRCSECEYFAHCQQWRG